MLENGENWNAIKTVALPEEFDGFAVDAFSISSYTAKGSKSSLLATGSVDNLAIAVGRSQSHIINTRIVDGVWSAQAFGVKSTEYLLERSVDLSEWQPVENGVQPDGFYLGLIDKSPPESGAFYRLSR